MCVDQTVVVELERYNGSGQHANQGYERRRSREFASTLNRLLIWPIDRKTTDRSQRTCAWWTWNWTWTSSACANAQGRLWSGKEELGRDREVEYEGITA
ncbi:hypothetical protein Vi05172_g6226 [Venturia inaequalis]|nr:hypothetical protein Vi05172_g6226 [Venturia inaequalis]